MPDWVIDQQPYEAPLTTAAAGYAATPPAPEESLSAFATQSSPIGALLRMTERGAQAGSSWLDQAVGQIGEANAGLPLEQPQQSPTLSAVDINKKYAPEGTTITDKPMTEGLAAVISQERSQDIERQGVIQRFTGTHAWWQNVAASMGGQLLDPLNVATAFVPGIGEETILGRLGYAGAKEAPLLARFGARGAAGFTAGVGAQAPLTALSYVGAQEEGTDLGIRQSLLDLAVAGGLNAAVHAGVVGPIADLFKSREGRALPADPMAEASAQTRYQATTSAVSQMADGRQVDIGPIFDEAGISTTDEEAQLRARWADLRDEIPQAAARGIAPEAFDRDEALSSEIEQHRQRLAELQPDRATSPEAVRARSEINEIAGGEGADVERRLEAVRASAPEDVIARLDDAERRLGLAHTTDTPQQAAIRQELLRALQAREDIGPQLREARNQAAGLGEASEAAQRPMSEREVAIHSEIAAVRDRLDRISIDRAQNPAAPLSGGPSRLAAEQAQIYKNGFAPGVPQDEFDRTNSEIYGPQEEELPKGEVASTKSGETKSEAELQVQDLERQWKSLEPATLEHLTPEERAELEGSAQAVAVAEQHASGYDQAANCLTGAGV